MTANLMIHPSLIMIAGGLLLAFVPQRLRSAFLLLVPTFALALIWILPEGMALQTRFLEFEITVLRVDSLSRLFATIFSIIAIVGNLFALKQKNDVELASALIYGGSAIGVTFAGDLITVFVFWELMALGSTMVILSAGNNAAYKASMRYFFMHLLGGVILMIGIITHIQETNSIAFEAMKPETIGTWLILIGFLVNAGAPPVSSWLPDAYPEASFSGTVFLSGFTTKTAVYVLLRGFPGSEILIFVGLYMIFYGIIYALLENDMRRILAYSVINQVGFMIVGTGIGTEMALNGAAAHAFTHIIYKGLLLMSAGAVFYMTGKRRCTDLGGLFRTMPLTTICAIIGALAISSFPLTSGFISKSMITQASIDQGLAPVWYLLEAASAGVFLHAGIKFPWFVFFQKDSGMRPDDPPLSMRAAMVIFAAICIGLGVAPGTLYALLPYPVDYVPYTVSHVVTMLQLLLFSGLAFFVLLPMMKRTETISLDLDWLYRTGLKRLVRKLIATFGPLDRAIRETAIKAFDRTVTLIFAGAGPTGILARTWSVGGMVAWMILLLGLYLVLNFTTL